jgi:Na+/proline symporter
MLTFAYSSVNWSLIQRYYCVPKERDAYKVGWLVVVLVLVTMPAILLPAMAGRIHLPGISDADSAQIYPMLCLKLLPVGMIGLVIAAMFSATMSMLSSDYNVCASVLTNDVYRRIVRPDASAKELVLVGRVMTVAVGIIPIGIALWMGRVSGENLFRNMLKLFSVATAPVAIPMMLGLFFKRLNNKGTLCGFAGGVGVGLTVFFLCPDRMEFWGGALKIENVLLIVTTAVTLSVSVIVSLMFPAKKAERERSELFLAKLDIPIGQMPEDDAGQQHKGAAAVSPFRVVGICILFIALMIIGIMPFVDNRFAFYLELIFVVSFLLIGGLMIFAGRKGRTAEHDNG